MGQYQNIFKDLILQSRLNNALVNEINNGMANEQLNVHSLKEHHLERVNREYAFHDMDLPIYDFFDGTQLINSLFSMIVVPVEYLKGKEPDKPKDEVLKGANPGAFHDCKERIRNLNSVRSNYYGISKHSVYEFFKHLRNALCHSGNGNIHFFPNGGTDIHSIIFYDEDIKKDNMGNVIKRYVFYAGLNIANELIPLVKCFDEIILALARDDDMRLDLRAVNSRTEEVLIGKGFIV